MKLLVGLGNPGMEYMLTPHNAGFLAIDRIAGTCDVSVTNRRGRAETGRARLMGHDVLLAKPETYMNLSGLSVVTLLRELSLGVEDLIVLYDELAFPLGTIKIATSGSANGHNGVKSVTGALGTEEWTRVRIGIVVGQDGGSFAAHRNRPRDQGRRNELPVSAPAQSGARPAGRWIGVSGTRRGGHPDQGCQRGDE